MSQELWQLPNLICVELCICVFTCHCLVRAGLPHRQTCHHGQGNNLPAETEVLVLAVHFEQYTMSSNNYSYVKCVYNFAITLMYLMACILLKKMRTINFKVEVKIDLEHNL